MSRAGLSSRGIKYMESISEEGSVPDTEISRFRWLLLFGTMLGFIIFFLVLSWTFIQGQGMAFTSDGLIGLHSNYMLFYLFLLNPLSSSMYRFLPSTIKYSVQILHVGIHSIVGVGSAIGLGAIITKHSLESPPGHCLSVHSWIGMTTLGLYYLQFIGGFLIFLLELTPKDFRTWVLPIHRLAGQFLLYSAGAAVVTGLFNPDLRNGSVLPPSLSSELMLNLAALLAVFYTFLMSYLLTNPAYARPIYPEEEILINRKQLARAYSGLGF